MGRRGEEKERGGGGGICTLVTREVLSEDRRDRVQPGKDLGQKLPSQD
jgi:hypothetical protein